MSTTTKSGVIDGASPTQKMALPGQFSVFIYLWRLLATAAVFLGHATRPDILFDVDFSLFGRATIPTFLLVSGYFTAMSFSAGGRFTGKIVGRYLQLHVFFVPASVLVLLMDSYLLHVGSPFVIHEKFDPNLSVERIAVDVIALLTFSGEYWSTSTFGQGVFSNMAIWTIDYIMAYVVMTGALYLLRGSARVLMFAAVCSIAGPTVLLLAPLWFAGVAAYRVHAWADNTNVNSGLHVRSLNFGVSRKTMSWAACLIMVAAVASWISLEVFGLGEFAYEWSKTLAPYEIRQYLGMAKRFLWQWCYIPILLAIIVSARFIFVGAVAPRMLKSFKVAANYSLPVYAIHFTTMYLVQSLIPDYTPRHDSLDPYFMIGATLVMSIMFGYVIFTWVKPTTDRWTKRIVNASNNWNWRCGGFPCRSAFDG